MYFQMTLTSRACGDWEQQTSLISLESNGRIVINYGILRSLMQTREGTHSGRRMKISVCWAELKWQRGLNCTLSSLLWGKVRSDASLLSWKITVRLCLFSYLAVQMSLYFVHLFKREIHVERKRKVVRGTCCVLTYQSKHWNYSMCVFM